MQQRRYKELLKFSRFITFKLNRNIERTLRPAFGGSAG